MKAKTAVILTTIYLVVFVILCQTGVSVILLCSFFSLSPLLLAWMVYTTLKDNSQTYPELAKNEEWGYLDIEKDKLGMF